MKIFNSRVAVVGDIHLGLHISNSMWHDISLNFGKWLKKTLIDKDIRDIIILGDVLDNRNEVSVPTLHVMSKFFKILEDFNVIIITGNHDCYYSRRSDVHSIGTLGDWSNITVVDTLVSVNLFNKNLTFCPWNTPIESIPKSDIIFGHFEINTFKMNGYHICETGFETQALLEKSPLIISGHFHCTEERNYKNGKILYAGSPYEHNWGERGDPKGIYILDIYENSLEFVANTKSPKHIKMRLSELLAIGKITDTIKNEFAGNIINFQIDEQIDQKIIDNLITKLYALNPLTLKTENIILSPDVVAVDEEITFEGIDIKTDIVDYVNNLGDVENKAKIVNYLMDAYEACKEQK
jgi:DNA repair exonuclease SbcCD nuclease subunit